MIASSPKVSVIVPTYNRPELLERALQSVVAQTLEDFEIIVVNDCGVALEETLSKYDKIVYVEKNMNSGASASRNLALKIARGKYINFLDDDDYFYPNHLQTLVDVLEQNEQYKVAYSNCLCATQKFMDGKWVTTHANLSYDIDFSIETLLVQNITPIHCVMFEHEILQKVGLFDEGIKILEDWDFWIKMGLQYPFYHVKTVTAEYSLREHGGIEQGNITSTRPDKDYTQIIYEKYAGIVKEKYPAVREAQEKVTQNNIKTAQNDKNWKILKEATKNITLALQTKNFMQAKEFYEQLKKQSLWASPDFAHVTQNLERQMTSIGL